MVKENDVHWDDLFTPGRESTGGYHLTVERYVHAKKGSDRPNADSLMSRPPVPAEGIF